MPPTLRLPTEAREAPPGFLPGRIAESHGVLGTVCLLSHLSQGDLFLSLGHNPGLFPHHVQGHQVSLVARLQQRSEDGNGAGSEACSRRDQPA